jgi:hypothetical protein
MGPAPMIGFIGISLQLQSMITAHTLNSFWLLTDGSLWRIPHWSEFYVTTDGQSVSLSWYKAAPIWGLRPYFYYRRTVAGLLMCGALSDERTGLSFTTAAGYSQRSHCRVRVPWDSRPYFTVSDLRLPFSSPPTTRRVMVEVFDPVSTSLIWISLIHKWTPFHGCLRTE